MQGKILIVDSIVTNRILLKVKLSSAFYDVLQASDATEAMTLAAAQVPDLIISALTLPDGSAAELVGMLQAETKTSHIPVLGVGMGIDATDRLAALSAGVCDVLRAPLDDTLLLGRVRSLIRAHNAAAEWRMRDDTSHALGFSEPRADFAAAGSTVLVTEAFGTAKGWISELRPLLGSRLSIARPEEVLGFSNGAVPDSFVLVVPSDNPTPALQVLSSIRAHASTRLAGVLVLQLEPDPVLGATALDLGADELMCEGFDADELALRVKSMTKRKRMEAQMRASVRTGLNAAVIDPLTGLHNRRYALPHLNRIASHSAETGRPYAVMLADLDHFKRINDVYGHSAGDAVLTETATRLKGILRAVDMVARIGGEEFLIVLPGAPLPDARAVATRLCRAIGSSPFVLPGASPPVDVTISIGLTIGGGQACALAQRANDLIDTADKALYAAKMRGRNQVTLSRPAA